ncbi:TadE/TadG family type IV pilus assembly protein [Sphingomicrobium lutaoense]|uniref:Flp pilus assembly protein TadG n=1 Tax=Sphingomicrobium lutaoense TaxID=515949 RepID=A0A839YXW9_9SPHN|nr:TadE family protein [Sphingomicrobium lutaoense]MBB3764019.1 Flp pilus assembly protein TadG [Sphingomicrobium lutaoense]
MIGKNQILRNEEGAVVVEFALALPVMILFVFGLFQLALVFQANSGVQHALGEAARFATIYPTPTDSDIQQRVVESDFGTHNGKLEQATVVTDMTGDFKTISISYTQPTDFIFFEGPTVDIQKSKRVYVAK